MSEGNVAILNTKLDILIEDFKGFKSIILGLLMAVIVPFAVYMVIQITDNAKDIAVVQAQMQVSDKAVKEEE